MNNLYLLSLLAVCALLILGYLLFQGVDRPQVASGGQLSLFCAAGIRYSMEKIADEYQKRYHVSIQVQYGGSNTLLSQLEITRSGDLFLAADDAYIRLAHEKGLTAEVMPLAWDRPVVAVRKENPKGIRTAGDLLRDDVKVALGTPDAAAIGRITRERLTASGHWETIEKLVTQRGVFKPTVNDVANDVKLGSVDAGIVWKSTVFQYPELVEVRIPELDAGKSVVEIAVLTSSKDPAAALRFARFVSARNAGLETFRANGFDVVEGDIWEDNPEVTFFAGSVNRRVLEPIVKAFEQREGVRVNTVFNGCGILTAQMRISQDKKDNSFPDMYMACDVYYLEAVKDWFQDAVNVSDTGIVIVVKKGNPKGIQGLRDLLKPGVRVAVGQPDQCTIGVLTRTLLEKEGIYQQLLKGNIVNQTATSALLVPSVTTEAADAALAYETDTLAELQRLDVIRIDSSLAKAVQPYSIARSSEYKQLGRRLFQHIARSQAVFESKGFHWRLPSVGGPTEKPPTEGP